jgi:primosomal protein N' (replication factor Y)
MSYKQSDRQPHYHVRDLALMLFTQRHYSVRFLGVEPSLELVEILREHHGRWEKISGSIPELEITSPEQGAKNSIIGYQLESALRENFERGKRSLLYYNRLGREPGLRCLDCSWRALCPDCHLALSPRGPAWVCRYCGHSEPAKTLCQRCQSVRLQPVGFGIQRLVQSLTREFPESKISVIEKNAPAGSLEKSNFVIATSSVFRTNLPSIHLAAIISLESELQQTEWWSREQALTTVKKVAGLSPSIERVIVQTRLENELSENLLKDSTTTLVRPELLDRQRFGFPPFVQLVKVSLRVENGDPLSQAEKLVELLRARKKDFPKLFSITPPSVYRSGKKGKVILLLKLNKNTSAEERTDLLRSVPDDWTIDVRPLQLGA